MLEENIPFNSVSYFFLQEQNDSLFLPDVASSVQNEFETSVSYKNDEDTGNGTDGSDDGNWTCEEEPLKGTDGSRIAAYHSGKATWRCYECG